MNNTINLDAQGLAEAIALTLESMAFVSVAPAEPPYAAAGELVLIEIDFSGLAQGTLRLAAPVSLGQLLVANIDDVADSDPDAVRDALKELLNVVSGGFLRSLGAPRPFEMSLPRASTIDGARWDELANGDGQAVVLDAEGSLLAVRIVQHA